MGDDVIDKVTTSLLMHAFIFLCVRSVFNRKIDTVNLSEESSVNLRPATEAAWIGRALWLERI